jgi:hypothetical protein
VARWWRRQQPWHAASRCGWYPPGPDGIVRGLHDPRFTGHGGYCPAELYREITTAQGIADQWRLIGEWARLSGAVGLPGWDDTWRHMSWAQMMRADMLRAPFPLPDDLSELGPVP